MEYFSNGYTLDIPRGGFPLSTDTMVLSDFVKPGKKILDLGSGCGTLGVLLCAKNTRCTVTGVEIDPLAHAAAVENIRRNGLESRISSICTDLRRVNTLFPSGSFDCCVSNPPYFSGGAASSKTPLARREDCCAPAELFAAAAWVLGTGGDFYLVHKPERLAQLCACATNAGLEPKHLRLVRHKAGSPVALILLKCRKGGKPGLQWEELTLMDENGQPTPQYRAIYHLQEE